MIRTLRPLAAIALLAAVGVVAAQGYPAKPVTVVVPFTAGGPTDTVARSLGQAMTKSLGQTVVVENVGGAGGTVGATRVKNAAPDGYTVLLHHIGMSTAPALYRKLAYNPQTDFEMIGLIVDVPMTMIARSDFPAKDFREFVTYVKANKAKLNLANAGLGAASHLCGLMFQSAIEADVTTVPFKGTADAMNAILGKQVDFMCDQTTNTTGQIKAGSVKAYAVTSAKRVPTLPDLPTMQEGGLKGFEVGIWHGRVCAKGHAESRDRQAGRCDARRVEGCGLSHPDDRARCDRLPGRPNHPCRIDVSSEKRDRKVGAGHQESRYLRRLTRCRPASNCGLLARRT